MALPEFTDDEQYLVNFVKSTTAVGASNSYMWGYLTGGVILAGFAAYHNFVPMMLAAFVVVCGFRIYEERLHLKSMPNWRSIIAKYEAACASPQNRKDDSDANASI